MKLYLKILSMIMLSLILIMGCSKSKSSSGPNPVTTSGVTGTNGLVTLNLGANSVAVTVEDSLHTGLSNVRVNGYLGHNNVLLTAYDTTGDFYPSITLTPLGAALAKNELPDRPSSPDEITGAAVAATIILYPVQQAAFGLTEATGFDGIVSDSWTVEQWHTGLLEDAYNIIDTVSTYDRGVFIHLSQTVGETLNAPFRTAIFLPNQYSDFATFSSLAGYIFHVFAGDTLHFCQMSYSGALLPILHIDNIVMHRNFWAQFTLVWGLTPYDLDSHLWTPAYPPDNTSYHVCYYRRGSQTTAPYADLDVDDTDSYGPEHITIYQSYTGSYTYAVHDYRSDDGLISDSHAVVSLLKPNGTVQTFTVPTNVPGVQENWWWTVCRIDGTTGAVTVVDSLSAAPPLPDQLKAEPSKN